MQKVIAILEKRRNPKSKLDDQFGSYGKYKACQLKGMPEQDSEYIHFKTQEIIYQVKFYDINHSFQTASSHFLGSWPTRFSTPKQTIQNIMFHIIFQEVLQTI